MNPDDGARSRSPRASAHRGTSLLLRQFHSLRRGNVTREEVGYVPRMPQQVPADGRRLRRTGTQPSCRCGPLKREVDHTARSCHLGQRVQRRAQDRRLALLVAGLSQQVAQRMLDGRKPGHAHGGRQIGDARQRDRAYARCLNFPLHQSHGPAADRSARDQDDDVHSISLHVPDHGRRALLQQHLRL
jgi:hypothetical protein